MKHSAWRINVPDGASVPENPMSFPDFDAAFVWAQRQSLSDQIVGVWEQDREGDDWECTAIAFGGHLYV